MIKPKRLKAGDTLGVVTCSLPITVAAPVVERAYDRLRSLGFTVREAPNTRAMRGHAAGTVAERVDALHAMFEDPAIDGILSFWGGYQSHQLLEFLDFDLIRRNPKVFVGYSDTTSLQVGITARAGLVTFSGPAGITFAKPELPAFTFEHFRKILMEPSPRLELGVSKEFSDNKWFIDDKMEWTANPGVNVFRDGKAEGEIIGGNVGTMLLLAGTKFWPDLRGKLLFIEDDESENSKTIDRYFTQLRQMGVFEQITGLVVGRLPGCVGFTPDDSFEMILEDALRGTSFPVVTGADFGHTDPLVTLPLGVRARVEGAKIELLDRPCSNWV